MGDVYRAAVCGQIEWYEIRISDMKKQIDHLKECKKELEGRI